MAPYRREIERVQARAAIIAARAASNRPPPTEQTARDYRELGAWIARLQSEIGQAMAGRPSLGPAEDCRRALQSALAHLPGARQ
jgi:hypothetical protein